MKNTNEISVSENICTENNYVKNNYTYTTTITLEECRMIEQRVKEEIQAHGKHMLDIPAEELLYQSKKYWCCAVKDGEKFIWCIFLMAVEKWWITLYEYGSLFIDPAYRWQGLGYILMENIITTYTDLPIYSITNVPIVKKNNEKLHQHAYTKAMLSKEILEILEMPAPLLDNDIIYFNDLLHTLLQTNA